MTSRDFCFWLQGYFELSESHSLTGVGFTPTQREKVKAHLALVFVHEIDPSMGGPEHQKKLNDVHGTGQKPEWAEGARLPGDGTILRC